MGEYMAWQNFKELLGMIWILARKSFLDELFMLRNGLPETCKHDFDSDKTYLLELVYMIRIIEGIHARNWWAWSG